QLRRDERFPGNPAGLACQPAGCPEGNVLLQLNPPDGERGGISPGDDAPYTDPDRRKCHPFPRGGGYCPPPLSCYRSARRIRLPIQKIPPERGGKSLKSYQLESHLRNIYRVASLFIAA